MSKKIAIALLLLPFRIFADSNMASYILDGRFVIYSPSVKELAENLDILFRKFLGGASLEKLNSLESIIRERMGVHIFNPIEAESIGIDVNGSVAYVHLEADKGYIVFTVKNKELLSYTLDNLTEPVPYNLVEGKYIIFSASVDILEYKNFKGINALPSFSAVAKALNFDWTQTFFWIQGTYFREKMVVNPGQYIFPDGDHIGLIVNINNNKIVFDAYTYYDDSAVREALKKSMVPLKEQKLTLLDYESGPAAVIGQTYFNLPAYIDSLILLDKAEELGLRGLFERLEKANIRIKENLFPYLRGRLSYVIRAYDPIAGVYNATFTMGISNEERVKEFISQAGSAATRAGKRVGRKTLFTREFLSIPMGKYTLYMGVAEGHFIVSTSEVDLNTLIKNIYEGRKGYLSLLPPSFGRAVKEKIYGGQNHIVLSQFLQKVNTLLPSESSGLLMPFETIEWHFYFQEIDGITGRRDTITGNFFRTKP